MGKKIGSVIKLDNKDIKLKIGTIDKKNPEVIYLEGGFYVKPILEKDNYKDDLETIKSTLNDLVKEHIIKNNYFKDNYMFFAEIADDWIKLNKKSFFSFQIYLKPSDNIINEQKKFLNVVNNIEYDTNFIKETFENNGYQVSKTKK